MAKYIYKCSNNHTIEVSRSMDDPDETDGDCCSTLIIHVATGEANMCRAKLARVYEPVQMLGRQKGKHHD